MTLSEIIARCSEADVEIPDKGKWKVFLVINDGSLFHQDVTESKDWGRLNDQRKEKVEMITRVAPKKTEVSRPSPIRSHGRGW